MNSMPPQGNEPLPCAKVMFFSCLLVPGLQESCHTIISCYTWLIENDKSCLLPLPPRHPDRIVAKAKERSDKSL
jgi:hypothetical protein